jgi:hypothetical protein
MSTRDEMRDEYALVRHVSREYDGKKVATTFYPVERMENLLAEFPVARVREKDSWAGYDAVIVDRASQPDAAARNRTAEAFGRYSVIEPEERVR